MHIHPDFRVQIGAPGITTIESMDMSDIRHAVTRAVQSILEAPASLEMPGSMATTMREVHSNRTFLTLNAIDPLAAFYECDPISEVASFFAPEEPVSKEEVEEMRKAISDGVIAAMCQFCNRHESGKGIWYPEDYRAYLREEMHSEMDTSFISGYASEDFFEKIGQFTFKLKEGKKASEALLCFLKGPTVADCGNATMACYYKCILDILGEDKFNDLFNTAFPLIIGQHGITDREKSPIFGLADYTQAAKQKQTGSPGNRPLQVGDECHFDGVIWCANKFPKGFSAGWNVIYIGDDAQGNQMFMAHGFEKPLTEKEINLKFIELYNRERTPQDEQDAIDAKNPRLYHKQINPYLKEHYVIGLEEFEKNPNKFIKGFLVGSCRNLNAADLVRLKYSSNPQEFMLQLKAKRLSEQ